MMHGFYRIAAATPSLHLGHVRKNTEEILRLARDADKNDSALVVFPELCLTGYSCADLFFQRQLLARVEAELIQLAKASAELSLVMVVGAPLACGPYLYNCAVVIERGVMRGVVPKSFIPNYREFYEQRWFTSGRDGRQTEIHIGETAVPFGVDLLFRGTADFAVGLELCEDLWTVHPPSGDLALGGATILLNLSASNELVGKADYRRSLVSGQSARCVAAYVYTSCGVGESSTDLVFSGHSMIAENGVMLAENARFQTRSSLIYADIDVARLQQIRRSETSFPRHEAVLLREIPLQPPTQPQSLQRQLDPHPFVPDNLNLRDQRCREIFSIQTAGLSRRLRHIGGKNMVIGISGGLDSTLAILVAAAARRQLNPAPGLIAVTLPGFGTSDRTHSNARKLIQALDAELREIDIVPACQQHFKDIGHDPAVRDITYENVQARERTQILMDIANHEQGIVIGTGDLSEIALGWSTYNGDHMSMYAVNCGVPKTLVRHLVNWVADQRGEPLAGILLDILATPVSPELLPPDASGAVAQKTEEVIGPYELHDFFLYHTVKYGATPRKILFLAETAFSGRYDREEIRRWLRLFIRRFFSQQFKRSCIPDGPKVGSIALSPRGDWRMPSDAEAAEWLAELDE